MNYRHTGSVGEVMKILIMQCSNDKSWYRDKVAKTYLVTGVNKTSYITKDGPIRKEDAEVIEK